MLKEQKTTSRNGVFFSVMRGGLLEGKKKTRKEILKMISSNSAATWFYRARERERERGVCVSVCCVMWCDLKQRRRRIY